MNNASYVTAYTPSSSRIITGISVVDSCVYMHLASCSPVLSPEITSLQLAPVKVGRRLITNAADMSVSFE